MEKRPESRRDIAYLGDEYRTQIEFTYWKDKNNWMPGDELDHIAFAVPDMDKAMKIFMEKKVEVTREPFYRRGRTNRVAFIKDLNCIWLEIMEQ